MKAAAHTGSLRLCPTDPKHGPLLAISGAPGLWCMHSDHDGRPKRHPAGASAASQHRWSLDELAALP